MTAAVRRSTSAAIFTTAGRRRRESDRAVEGQHAGPRSAAEFRGSVDRAPRCSNGGNGPAHLHAGGPLSKRRHSRGSRAGTARPGRPSALRAYRRSSWPSPSTTTANGPPRCTAAAGFPRDHAAKVDRLTAGPPAGRSGCDRPARSPCSTTAAARRSNAGGAFYTPPARRPAVRAIRPAGTARELVGARELVSTDSSWRAVLAARPRRGNARFYAAADLPTSRAAWKASRVARFVGTSWSALGSGMNSDVHGAGTLRPTATGTRALLLRAAASARRTACSRARASRSANGARWFRAREAASPHRRGAIAPSRCPGGLRRRQRHGALRRRPLQPAPRTFPGNRADRAAGTARAGRRDRRRRRRRRQRASGSTDDGSGPALLRRRRDSITSAAWR
jgi:hypothetical protein